MKKYMSVLMMCARQSVYKLLSVIIVMVVCEWIWFSGLLKSAMSIPQDKWVYYGISLEKIYNSFELWGILVLSWLAFTVILSIYGCRVKTGSPSIYRRLQVSRGKIFWVQVIYNFFSYGVLLSVQLIMFFWMGRQYGMGLPEHVGPQTVFLALGGESYFYHPSAADMASPFVGIIGWILRILSVAVFSFGTASILTGILAVEDGE